MRAPCLIFVNKLVIRRTFAARPPANVRHVIPAKAGIYVPQGVDRDARTPFGPSPHPCRLAPRAGGMSMGVNMIFPTGRKNRKGGVSDRPKSILRLLIPLLVQEGAAATAGFLSSPPRRRGSTAAAVWIPAFAGMTTLDEKGRFANRPYLHVVAIVARASCACSFPSCFRRGPALHQMVQGQGAVEQA